MNFSEFFINYSMGKVFQSTFKEGEKLISHPIVICLLCSVAISIGSYIFFPGLYATLMTLGGIYSIIVTVNICLSFINPSKFTLNSDLTEYVKDPENQMSLVVLMLLFSISLLADDTPILIVLTFLMYDKIFKVEK